MSRITKVTVGVVPYLGPPEPRGVGCHLATPLGLVDGAESLLRGDSTAGLQPGETMAIVVQLEDEEGRVGAGTAGFGHPAVLPVLEQLSQIVIGRRASDYEWCWEAMYRSTLNIGRTGVVLHAISGIDIAMWDLLGRQVDLPVYRLLGGPVREKQPAYASVLHPTTDLDSLAEQARACADLGFSGMKLWLSAGPSEGLKGIKRNLGMVTAVTDAIGPEIDFMVDAYMGWDVNYAIRTIRAFEDAGVRLRWVEEPIPPHDVAGLARIRKAVDTPIAAGEHEATRYGFRQLVDCGAVDVLQPDPMRLGGITESRRVWALGETYGLHVIGHLGYAANMHLSISSLASPLVEYFPPHTAGVPDEDEVFRWLFPDEPLPESGLIEPSDRPGLGITLEPSRLEPRLEIDADGVRTV